MLLGISLKKCLQIGMDGPNVNKAFYNDFTKYLKENMTSDDGQMIDTGSCAIHIIHGCYKTAHQKTTWHINTFLRVAYNLFKNFPSRRSDFIYYSGSTLFPKKCVLYDGWKIRQ